MNIDPTGLLDICFGCNMNDVWWITPSEGFKSPFESFQFQNRKALFLFNFASFVYSGPKPSNAPLLATATTSQIIANQASRELLWRLYLANTSPLIYNIFYSKAKSEKTNTSNTKSGNEVSASISSDINPIDTNVSELLETDLTRGEWKPVARGTAGLQHQANMSRQEIVIGKNGKAYINEFEYNGVLFDDVDFKGGKLIDYKGDYSFAIGKDGTFQSWFKGVKGLREEALSQVRAANGTQVVWNVGENQVTAFKEATSGIEGLKIEP